MNGPENRFSNRLHQLVRSLFRFAGAGLGAFVVLYSGTAFLVELAGWPERTAYALMLTLVSIAGFLVQQRFVFGERRGVQSTRIQALKFAGSIVFFRTLEWLLFAVLVDRLGISYLLAMPAVVLVSFLGKFAVYDRWVFKQKRPEQ